MEEEGERGQGDGIVGVKLGGREWGRGEKRGVDLQRLES